MKKLILTATLALTLTLSASAQKFAHFNSAQIIQAMPEYTAAQTELQTLQKTYTDELKKMQDEIETKSQEYEKEAEKLPDAVKQRREQELNDLYKRYQEYGQTGEADLQKASQTKMQEISEKIGKAVKEVGSTGGFVYVMDVTAGIPYISETLSTDVTDQIKTKLGIK
ncbi:MAG: OmpH family outer membrane protein [Bacteroidaceae bacterium]|nr:OmpH family outer membrane protein [Bacteroidaceae bacterium]